MSTDVVIVTKKLSIHKSMYIYTHVCKYKHFKNHIGIPKSLFLRITFHVVSFILSSEVKYNDKLRIYPWLKYIKVENYTVS